MLRIWGRLSSINVRKVVWAVQETGVPFERIEAGAAFGVVKTPEYLAHNPNALVPLLQDGDFFLWESNVIVRYLAARYAGAPLYPTELPQRFDAERWMDWQQTSFNPAGREAFIQWIRTPAEQRQSELIARSVAATEPLLAMLERHLSQRAYIAGDEFTMADIPLGCEMHRWFGLPQPSGEWPQVQRWYASLMQRPAARGVLDLPLT